MNNIKIGSYYVCDGIIFKLKGIDPHSFYDFISTTNKKHDSYKCLFLSLKDIRKIKLNKLKTTKI